MWLTAEITTDEPILEPIPIAEEFHARRRAKHEAGQAARGRAFGEPFVGDPSLEAQEECLDQGNYADECARQGKMSAEELEWVMPIIVELYAFFRAVEQR